MTNVGGFFVFYEQLNRICKQKNTTPTAVTKKLGYSSSKVTAWKNGSIPKQEILVNLADCLGVNTKDFFDDEKVSETDTKKIHPSIDERIFELAKTDENIAAYINAIVKLSPEARKQAAEYVQLLELRDKEHNE